MTGHGKGRRAEGGAPGDRKAGGSGEGGGGFERFTYYLVPAQARALKILAAETGRAVSELAREALDQYLARREKKRK